MPATIFGASAAVTILNRAFNDVSPSFAVFANQVIAAGTSTESIHWFANRFGQTFDQMSDAALANKVLSNMGLLPNADLLLRVATYFAANPDARGLVVLQIAQILCDQESATGAMAAYAAAALAWNNEVLESYRRSTDPTNVTESTPGDGVYPLIDAKTPAENALGAAKAATEIATAAANTLISAVALQADAKIKADATDALALTAAGNTADALAAAADDAAFAIATIAFTVALAHAQVKGALAKLAADLAVVQADVFVAVAARTTTSIADDTAAAAIMTQALPLLAAVNVVRATVDAIASGAAPAPSIAPDGRTDAGLVPSVAAHGAQPGDAAQDQTIALVGVVDLSTAQVPLFQ